MKILFLPTYSPKGASSRYRTYQYLEFYKNKATLTVKPLMDDTYKPAQYLTGKQSKTYIVKRYIKRFFILLGYYKYDAIFLEKEFFPYVPFFTFIFKLFNIKYIVDYDDAIFHQYDKNKNKWIRKFLKNKIKKVIKNAQYVTTGSPYLTAYAQQFNDNVVEIPTSIDFRKYDQPFPKKKNEEEKLIIGWIGSKTTSKNLIALIPVFEKMQKNNINFELRFIGFDLDLQEQFKDLPIKLITWTAESEVQEIKQFTVGIMPLKNDLFNRGKCAFKLIQYMASGIATISTPMEANIKVDRGIGNLFADTNQEWEDCFMEISKNITKFKEIGLKNIENIQKHYSVQANYKEYLKIFRNNTLK